MSRGSRGRGRPRWHHSNNNPRGRGRGINTSPSTRHVQSAVRVIEDAIDFPVAGPSSPWAQNQNVSKPNTPTPRGRSRGKPPSGSRGRGVGYTPLSALDVSAPPPGWGEPRSPRSRPYYVRGRGRGRGRPPAGKNPSSSIPLSKLLYEDRPLLRPIKFVPSVLTPQLFRTEEEEEDQLLKPLVIQQEDEDHLDRLFFQRSTNAENEEVLEEIDFSEVGIFQEKVDKHAAMVLQTNDHADTVEVEEGFTGILLKDKQEHGTGVSPGGDTGSSVAPYTAVAETVNQLLPQERSPSQTPPTQTSPPTETQSLPEPLTLPVSEESVSLPLAQGSSPSPSQATLCGLPISERYILTPQPTSKVHSTVDTPDSTDSVPIPPDRTDPIIQDEEHAPEPKPPPPDSSIAQPTSPEMTTSEAVESGSTPQAPESSETAPFFIDLNPSTPLPSSIATVEESSIVPLGASTPISIPPAVEEEEEEIIVYSPPNPSSKFSRTFTPVSVSNDSREASPFPNPPRFSLAAMSRSPHAVLRERVKARRVLTRRSRKGKERMVEQEDDRPGLGSKRIRREGSDIDWGSEEEEGADEEVDMQVDEELVGDMKGMETFVKGMERGWVTMDDLEDELRGAELLDDDEEDDSQKNDEEGDESEEDAEEDDALEKEEMLLVGEREDDSEDSEEDFEDKWKRLKESTHSRLPDGEEFSGEYAVWSDEEDDDELELYDDFFLQLQELASRAAASSSKNRKGKKHGKKAGQKLENKKANEAKFHAIANGSFDIEDDDDDNDDDDEEDFFPLARKRSKKPTHLPADLQAQWEKDRLAKAERKRLRELERLQRATDPFSSKKGGRKGKRDMLLALSLDPNSSKNSPNRIVDIPSLVSGIRVWVSQENREGRNSMVLPPCPKDSRVVIHRIATIFGLKSHSKGKGDGRYTTLVKTNRTKCELDKKDEGKLKRILRGDGVGGEFVRDGKTRSAGKMPRDGDVVGHAAPKLTQSNVGFQLLARMGWEEGDRIGLAAHNTKMTVLLDGGTSEMKAVDHGGAALDAPLLAIVKNTKLGLGASM